MKFKVKIKKESVQVGTAEFVGLSILHISEYYMIYLKYEDGTELEFEWYAGVDRPLTKEGIARKAQELYREHLCEMKDQETDKKHVAHVEQLNGQEFELGT